MLLRIGESWMGEGMKSAMGTARSATAVRVLDAGMADVLEMTEWYWKGKIIVVRNCGDPETLWFVRRS